jgi:hypothetical protein
MNSAFVTDHSILRRLIRRENTKRAEIERPREHRESEREREERDRETKREHTEGETSSENTQRAEMQCDPETHKDSLIQRE